MGRLKWIAVLLGGQSGTKYAQVGDLQYPECLPWTYVGVAVSRDGVCGFGR